MDPDQIELNNLTKSFEYIKLASEIDSCDDRETLETSQNLFANFIINNKKQCKL